MNRWELEGAARQQKGQEGTLPGYDGLNRIEGTVE